MHMQATGNILNQARPSFFVYSDGRTYVQNKGQLTEYQIRIIQRYIKKHYMEMYEMWARDTDTGFYHD